jgi:flagellar biogenesis protein FliO
MDNAASLFQAFAALVFVLCLIGLCGFLARRVVPLLTATAATVGASRRLRIIEVLRLDTRRQAVLVRCDDKDYLLALAGDGGITLIAGDLATVKQDARHDAEAI